MTNPILDLTVKEWLVDMRRSFLALIVGLVLGAATTVSGQGPFAAQIQAAIRALLAGDQTVTGTWTFDTAPVGVGNPFDQDLNTTDSPTFSNVTVNSATGTGTEAACFDATGLLVRTGCEGGGGTAFAPTLTPMVSGDFTWVNQDTATVTVNGNGGVYLQAPDSLSGLHIRKKAAPSTPYAITMAFIPKIYFVSFQYVGFVWRQSSDGKLVSFDFSYNSAGIRFVGNKHTNADTFSAEYFNIPIANVPPILYYCAQDNGTNRIMSISFDGYNYDPVHTVGNTDFLTADEIGFHANSGNAAQENGILVLGWNEGTSCGFP